MYDLWDGSVMPLSINLDTIKDRSWNLAKSYSNMPHNTELEKIGECLRCKYNSRELDYIQKLQNRKPTDTMIFNDNSGNPVTMTWKGITVTRGSQDDVIGYQEEWAP